MVSFRQQPQKKKKNQSDRTPTKGITKNPTSGAIQDYYSANKTGAYSAELSELQHHKSHLFPQINTRSLLIPVATEAMVEAPTELST
jgi:hypothetical protein